MYEIYFGNMTLEEELVDS